MKQEIVLRMLRGEALVPQGHSRWSYSFQRTRYPGWEAHKMERNFHTIWNWKSKNEAKFTRSSWESNAQADHWRSVATEPERWRSKSVEIGLLYQKVHKLEAGLYPVGTSVGRSQSRNGRRSSQYDFDLNWKKYGVQKVCQVWEFSRSTFYAQKHRVKPMHRRGWPEGMQSHKKDAPTLCCWNGLGSS